MELYSTVELRAAKHRGVFSAEKLYVFSLFSEANILRLNGPSRKVFPDQDEP